MELRRCKCGNTQLKLGKHTEAHFEIRCPKCLNFSWGSTPQAVADRWNKEQDPNYVALQPENKKECCTIKSNLKRLPGDPNRPDVVIDLCIVCGCKHIRFKADPGKLTGILGSRNN